MSDLQLDHISQQLDLLRVQSANLERLLKLSLMAAASPPTTSIGQTFQGTTIGTTPGYFELYRNDSSRLIAVTVRCDFTNPGNIISLSNQNGANGEIDVLGASTRTVSSTLWVRPNTVLYIGSRNTTFTLNGSVFRVLLFDPLVYAGYLGDGV